MTDILERLKNPQTVYDEDDYEYGIYENAAAEVEKLRALLFSRGYFICGQSDAVDQHGLPNAVQICPAYGLDWAVSYRRVDP